MFKQADRFDTPVVSRWTWMIGIGWVSLLMGGDEDAVKSLSIDRHHAGRPLLYNAGRGPSAVGPAGRSKEAVEKGRELRPGSTIARVPTPKKNSSPVYIEAAERIMQLMIAAGLPAS